MVMHCVFFLLKIRRPPRSTRTDPLFTYTTLFRSPLSVALRHLTKAKCAAHGDESVAIDAEEELAALRQPQLIIIPALHFIGAEPMLCAIGLRSEEHTSELQSLMRSSYAVFCL